MRGGRFGGGDAHQETVCVGLGVCAHGMQRGNDDADLHGHGQSAIGNGIPSIEPLGAIGVLEIDFHNFRGKRG